MIAHDENSFIIPTRFVEVESVVEDEIISSDSESENIDIINFKERPEKKDEPNDDKKDEMKEEETKQEKKEEKKEEKKVERKDEKKEEKVVKEAKKML